MFEAIKEAIMVFRSVKPKGTIWVQVNSEEWIELPKRYFQD